MKKTLAVMAFFMAISVASHAEPNEKVLKAFVNAFPTVVKVDWGGTNAEPVAYFTQGNVQSRVSFDKEGNFLRSLRYYGEKELPTNVICNLKKKFPDTKITGVTEVSDAEGNTAYFIKITDATHWRTLKTTNGSGFEVTEKYKLQTEG